MQNTFDNLITTYLESNVGLATNFISVELACHLKENLLSLLSNNLLKPAGVGNNLKLISNSLIRSDKIYWLDRNHNNEFENAFFDIIDEFINYLNQTCYTGIVGYEFHYALYEKGTFYKRHLDQFSDNNSRAFTMIMYLNEGWQEEDGGKLCIYLPNQTQHINPENGTCVFFKSSELEHEVLLSHKQRLSITGWLKTN